MTKHGRVYDDIHPFDGDPYLSLPLIGSPYANEHRTDIRQHCPACGAPAGTARVHMTCVPNPVWRATRELALHDPIARSAYMRWYEGEGQ